MRDAVLDASVVAKWFKRSNERNVAASLRLYETYEAGDLRVTTQPLLHLEILNVAGRKWSWSRDALLDLAAALDELEFRIAIPDLSEAAVWTARGLTAYDAGYVALAYQCELPLITEDDEILSAAPDIARRAQAF